jgi:hypothetical protein
LTLDEGLAMERRVFHGVVKYVNVGVIWGEIDKNYIHMNFYTIWMQQQAG